MASLKQSPEIGRHSRPLGVTRDPHTSTKNWLEARHDECEFLNDDPQVIIVGAGHSGLMLAARLKRLSVRTLVIDMQKRLGDSWRLRYKSLVLHDHIWANYFPYLKYPDDWPVFIPKDKLANWLEIYASVMELNIVGATARLPKTHGSDAFISGLRRQWCREVLLMTMLRDFGI